MAKFPSIIIGKREDHDKDFGNKGCAIHFLKIESKYFYEVRSGRKKAEFRRNDRDFRKGDAVVLMEIQKKKETGNFLIAEIDHVLFDFDHKDLPIGFAMLSLRVVYPDQHTRAFR
ncbi:MAG: hypothetical protein JWP89_2586 [Schlesneria sp.]|nr:hypothetical protein [Schlesneria sp.]